MNQSREIKTFLFGQYFSDGLRITVAVLLPSLVMAQFGLLPMGITISIGALAVSIADGPGPEEHKRNGMLACIICVFLVAFITGFMNVSPYLKAADIVLACFFFSMFNVYGNRAMSIGTASLLVMILSLDITGNLNASLTHALLLLSGGLWYFLLSLSLSRILPYRPVQHALGVSIRQVAEYVRIKAQFYNTHSDYDTVYKKLITQQITVNEEQDNVRDVLFKSRQVVKESTNTSRQLLLVFVDVVDLFEQTMATHFDYTSLKNTFAKTGILADFEDIINKVSDELENLSYYINSNELPVPKYQFQYELEKLKTAIDEVETKHLINNLILKKILINIRNIANRIQKIYSYYKAAEAGKLAGNLEVIKFVSHQEYSLKLFKDNLSFKSATFRHALRMSIVCLAGFLISKLFPLGHHGYWILLTILVILKPGFSITKERNTQRLIGTIAGGLVGSIIIYLIKDETARLITMVGFMLIAYSFQRLNYVVNVLFTTAFIIIMFSFLGLGNLSIVKERVLDTMIGCVIAFGSSFIIFPAWEHTQIKTYMQKTLVANYFYLGEVGKLLINKSLNATEFKLIRKEVYVSTANLASAFQRMISEPKSKQKNAADIQKFVVMNHILSSYIATLISSMNETDIRGNAINIKQIRKAMVLLAQGIHDLESVDGEQFKELELPVIDQLAATEFETLDSKIMVEQLNFVLDLSGDIQKICLKMAF